MSKHRAFAFWEVLIVVAILAIGCAALFPPRHGNRENARRASCASNLKQIGLAFRQYAQDYDAKIPPVANANGGWSQLIAPYLKSAELFQCPSTQRDVNGTSDYFLNARLAGAEHNLSRDTKDIATTILCGDGDDDQNASYNLAQFPAQWRTDESSPIWRHLNTGNILFVDGHVKAYQAKRIFAVPAEAATPTFEVK